MHSHVIPGIDDGAKTMDDSITLVTELYYLGFRKLITTPHIISDYFKNTPESIREGLERLREAIAKTGVPIEINAAAEYYLDDDFAKKIVTEPLLTLKGNYLLFELSYINRPDNLKEAIFQMQMKGYKPVLAHPERYPFFYNDFNEYKELKELGVLFQINTNSLTGYYSLPAKRIAEKMIDFDMIDFIGTDAHHGKHIASLKKCLHEKSLKKLIASKKLLNLQL